MCPHGKPKSYTGPPVWGIRHVKLFRNALGIFSEGASMSVLFATTYPDRVPPGSFRRPSPHRRPVSPSFSPAEADERLANLVKRWGSGSFLANVFASEASNPDAAARIAKFEKLACSPGAIRSYIISNRRIDVNAILPCVRAPTLILHRATEAQVPVALAVRRRLEYPGRSTLSILPEITHSGPGTPRRWSGTSRNS
jgi:hypothetical protein